MFGNSKNVFQNSIKSNSSFFDKFLPDRTLRFLTNNAHRGASLFVWLGQINKIFYCKKYRSFFYTTRHV